MTPSGMWPMQGAAAPVVAVPVVAPMGLAAVVAGPTSVATLVVMERAVVELAVVAAHSSKGRCSKGPTLRW